MNAKTKFLVGPLLWFALLLASYPLYAEDYEHGREAYLAEDYQEAARVWQSMAVDGDPRAQFSLGQLYLEGLGVEKDEAESARWFRFAAEQGLAPAQFNLGNAYKHGRGVRKDDIAAAVWWRRAAEQELAPAQFNLAMVYTFGRGVPKDEERALEWYRRAAANGHPDAQQILEIWASSQPSEAMPAGDEPAAGIPREPQVAESNLKREDWILAQDSLHFTVQVIASHAEASLIRALGKHDLGRPLAYFRFLRHGESWYAAVYGVFASHSEAQSAADLLPQALRDNSPWIRQFGALQALIRNLSP